MRRDATPVFAAWLHGVDMVACVPYEDADGDRYVPQNVCSTRSSGRGGSARCTNSGWSSCSHEPQTGLLVSTLNRSAISRTIRHMIKERAQHARWIKSVYLARLH